MKFCKHKNAKLIGQEWNARELLQFRDRLFADPLYLLCILYLLLQNKRLK